jgi:hypothetical protein
VIARIWRGATKAEDAEAVFYPDDDAFLVDRGRTVRDYDVVGLHMDGES